MKLLSGTSAQGEGRHLVLLFGLGLVGSAVARKLNRLFDMSATHFAYDWTDAQARAGHLAAIEAAVDAQRGPGLRQIDIVWTGGRSGFASRESDMKQEYDIVAQIVAVSERLCARVPEALHSFHLLSSAGGLFEGNSHCTTQTMPAPQRPYGHGKLAQEVLLQSLPQIVRRRVYRPSSVYGYTRNGRVGLIAALIRNGLTARQTNIFGRLDTLRDYVQADDIGEFIAQEVQSPSDKLSEQFLLATGQPVTMHEVITIVEEALDRPLYLQFDPRPSNASDITFMQSALPYRWRPSPLHAGIIPLFSQLCER